MKQFRALFGLFILLLCAGGCSANQHPQSAITVTIPTAGATAPAELSNELSFTASGALAGNFALHTTSTISMLRHGHKEFTIDLVDTNRTIFLVFYGYNGPGTYHLVNRANGGEVHISLGTQQETWDLAATAGGSCDLVITSDQPTRYSGIDSMQGNFSCPHLSSPPRANQHATDLNVSRGQFNIFILVVS